MHPPRAWADEFDAADHGRRGGKHRNDVPSRKGGLVEVPVLDTADESGKGGEGAAGRVLAEFSGGERTRTPLDLTVREVLPLRVDVVVRKGAAPSVVETAEKAFDSILAVFIERDLRDVALSEELDCPNGRVPAISTSVTGLSSVCGETS